MPSLSFPLSGPHGADGTEQPVEVLKPAEQGLDRLAEQFKEQPNLRAFLSLHLAQFEDLEAAHQSMVTLTNIDDSSGVQLDTIGKRIGEPRLGFEDVEYRLHLKAKVILNFQSGTIPELIHLFKVLVGSATTVRVEEFYPAALELSLDGIALDDTLVGYLVEFLGRAKAAGVKAVLRWSSADSADSFSFASGDGLGFNDGQFTAARYA